MSISSDTLGRLPAPATKRSPTSWTEVERLLANGAYEEVIWLLDTRRNAGQVAGDPAQAAVFNAIYQLCQACVQLRNQQNDYQRALRRTARFEDDTRRRIGQLLEPVWEVESIDLNSRRLALPGGPSADLIDRVEYAARRPADGFRAPPVESAPADYGEALTSGASVRAPMDIYPAVLELTLIKPAAPPALVPEPEFLEPITFVVEPAAHPLAIEEIDAEIAVAPAEAALLPAGAPDLRVYSLGKFQVYGRDRLIDDWTGHKSRALLKYFLIHRDKPAHTDQLLDVFWRDSPPETARRSLHQTIYLLRQSLRPAGERPSIVQVNGGYMLNPELDVWVDSEVFLGHYRQGVEAAERDECDRSAESLLAAETLYEGDFMSEELYEDWPVARREQARNAYLDLLDRLSFHFYSGARDDKCITYCRKLLDIDNCREDIHRRLMRVFARRGERSRALRQYRLCVAALRAELDVDPLPETVELYAKILNNNFQG